MGDDENLQNHPNWNAILQWSLRFQDEPSENRVLEPMDQERRQFLTRAFENYSAMVADPVKSMRGHVVVLKNPDSSKEECVLALEDIADHAEDLDEANDLYLMGGLQVCCAYIKHNDPELQSLACEVIANAVQNNEKIAQFASDTFVLSDLLKLVDNSANDTVRVKSLLAVSCLVRGNTAALEKFNQHEGYNVIVRALQSPLHKLQIKSLFLINHVCVESTDQCQLYSSMGVPHQLFAMCDRFATEDRTAESYDATLQITLKLLLHLVERCDVQFPPHAAASFETLRVCLVEDSVEEEREICKKLKNHCPAPADEVDR
ncbi:hsp70-binding protein 1-like [Bolinopsis microptera]|uniref:hsp70-binding protein 1-like n=1 Tax=Bolinopsis microptera TaxID=2820187 RepID=UPI003078CCBC